MAEDLKKIYSTKTVAEAETALTNFAQIWDGKYPAINAIKSLNITLRKFIKNKRVFPSDEAAFKQIYLAMQIIAKKWTMPIRDWKPALARFTIEFDGRI